MGMIALVLAVCGACAYGVADFLGGFAARSANVFRVVAVSAPASLAVELVLLPVLGATWSPAAVLWGAISGIASAAAFVLLYLALAIGPMGVLSPITAIVSALLPVLVGLLGGERLPLIGLLGVPVSLAAILLVSVAPMEAGARVRPGAVAIAIGAGTAIAAQLIALDAAPHDSGVAPLVIGRAVSSLIVIAVVLIRRRGAETSARPRIALAAAAGALDSIANVLFLLAARGGMLTISAVVVALYPAATVLLARTILAERLGRRQWAGLAVAAVGIGMLALA